MRVIGTDKSLSIYMKGGETEQLRRIVCKVLPQVMEKFAAKNAEYGENAFVLGERGQFSDIWRKIAKLKTAIWDGHPEQLVTEGPDEIMSDLIGHLLLTLDMREQDLLAMLTTLAISADEPNAQQIREAKGGPETWIDTEQHKLFEPAAKRYSPSYLVVTQFANVKGHVLEIAYPEEKRCQWFHGDTRIDPYQCLGYRGHTVAHINRAGEAWA